MDEARAPLTYALGDRGRLPFLGHFRAEVRGPGSVLRIAGRRAASASVTEAHRAAAELERALQTAVVGMLEHGAARSPDLAAVLEPEQEDPPVEAVG